jgi:hypothetical protein
MGYSVILQYMYITCNDQTKVIITSITSNIYYVFVLGTFKILSSSCFEIFN